MFWEHYKLSARGYKRAIIYLIITTELSLGWIYLIKMVYL